MIDINKKHYVILTSLVLLFIMVSITNISAASSNNTNAGTIQVADNYGSQNILKTEDVDKNLIDAKASQKNKINKTTHESKENTDIETNNTNKKINKKINSVSIKKESNNTINKKNKVDPEIKINNPPVVPGNNSIYTASLPKDATGNGVFKINGKTISKALKVANGTVKYEYKVPNSFYCNKYTLTFKYSGNDKYEAKYVNTSLMLGAEKINPKIGIKVNSIIPGKTSLITAQLPSDAKGKVAFKLNGKTISKTLKVANGSAEYKYKIPKNKIFKTYNITVAYSGDIKYLSTSANTTHDIDIKTGINPNMTVNNPQIKYLNSGKITVELPKNATGKIIFKLNKTSSSKKALANGKASYTYIANNAPGKYNVEIYYSGDVIYSNSTINSTVTVTKLHTKSILNQITSRAGQNAKFIVQVTNAKKQPIANTNAIFKINNKTIGQNNTNATGYAVYNYKLPVSIEKNQYPISAIAGETQTTFSSAAKSILKLNPVSTKITISPVYVQIGTDVNITAIVIDENNQTVKNGIVTYKINNKTMKADVKHGLSTINYRPEYKYSNQKIKIIATLDSNSRYNSSKTNQTINVLPLVNVYVSKTGNDNNLGDKLHPFKTLNYALGHVAATGKIHLANGIYSGSELLINNSVSIIGSSTYKTIVVGAGKDNPIFAITDKNALVNFKYLTIKNGLSTQSGSAGAIVSLGKLNITSVHFKNNKALGNNSGGAICTNGATNLTNVQFINNSANNPNAEGGALRTMSNTVVLKNVMFINNSATGSNSTGGGAIYSKYAGISLYSCQFHNNKATGNNVVGGAIKSVYSVNYIFSNTFKNNNINGKNYGFGGAIGSLGSAIKINNSLMESNYVKSPTLACAGALYIQYASLIVGNSTFNKNYAKSDTNSRGGAIEGQNSNMELINTYLNNNNATATSKQASGGAIYKLKGTVTIIKSEFNNNKAIGKTAIGGAIHSTSNLTIKNSNFYSNQAKGQMLGGGAIANLANMTVTRSNFIKNSASNVGNAITASSSKQTSIEGNYWGSKKPGWDYLLRGLYKPSKYSKTKIKN